jgi:hypothetical protein
MTPPVERRLPASLCTARDERGAAMIIALFMILSMIGMGLSAVYQSGFDIRLAANDYRSREALYVAEAGLAHAIDYLRYNYLIFEPEGWNGTDLLWPTGDWVEIVPETEFAGGTYRVILKDDDDGGHPPPAPLLYDTPGKWDNNRGVIIRSVGRGVGGGERMIEILMEAEEVV